MKKNLIVAASLLSVILISSNAFAWGRGGGGFGRGGCGGFGPGQVSLTQEQQTQLADLRQKFIDETYETRAAMMDKTRNLDMLMETSAPDKAKATALVNEISELRKQMFNKQIEYTLAAKKIAPALDLGTFRHMGRGLAQGPGLGRGFGPCNFDNGADAPGPDQGPVNQ